MNHIIVGYGEVGKALHEFFPAAAVYDPYMPGAPAEQIYDVLHVCFPYGDLFEGYVKSYQNRWKPELTIIHSSVPIGTSDRLGAVHSPIRGVHPRIAEGIGTFVKYFGGFKAHEAARIFEEKGIRTKVVSDSRTVEALKLWDTTQYGAMILLEKEIWEFCRKHGLDFDVVYTQANETYNEGYRSLGMAHVQRPVLMHKEGKIGGHCVRENAELLDTHTAHWIRQKGG